MAQILVPTSDQAAGSWTSTPLWSKVDDDSTVSPSGDGTTIVSADNSAPDNADFKIASGTDPESSTGHILRARWNKSASGGHAINAVLELWEGVPGTGTLRGTLAVTGIGNTETGSTYTLSAAEADAIGDYTNLYLRVSRQGDTGGPPSGRRSLVVDLVEFEIPDAPAASGRIEASWAEFETPETPTRFDVSWAELETGEAPTRIEASWAELETGESPTRFDVSWAEVEAPHLPTRLEASWAELETPESPTRLDVSWAELETGEAPTRIEASWAELELPSAGGRLEVSWAELESPEAPTRLEASWAEFETGESPTRIEASWAELETGESPTRLEASWAELETGESPTRIDVSWAELQAGHSPTRLDLSWAAFEAPEEGGGPPEDNDHDRRKNASTGSLLQTGGA